VRWQQLLTAEQKGSWTSSVAADVRCVWTSQLPDQRIALIETDSSDISCTSHVTLGLISFLKRNWTCKDPCSATVCKAALCCSHHHVTHSSLTCAKVYCRVCSRCFAQQPGSEQDKEKVREIKSNEAVRVCRH
jgi:hypothetical protein